MPGRSGYAPKSDERKRTFAATSPRSRRIIDDRASTARCTRSIGNTLYAPGKAQPKKPSEHKIVGSGSPEAKAQQEQILQLLRDHGAA
ncbi:MAG TPA: hypothetical protein VG758_22410 [Hyphomicrobiaceae bacterium]|jgi:hypothetical protein|nr:hypothetical protein [Hyphomicrobiaceae bacterium]